MSDNYITHLIIITPGVQLIGQISFFLFTHVFFVTNSYVLLTLLIMDLLNHGPHFKSVIASLLEIMYYYCRLSNVFFLRSTFYGHA